MSFTSRLEGDEPRGKGFTWHAMQVLNGAEREVRGTVEKKDGAWQVDRTTPDGPQPSVLPSFTHMPVAAVDWLLRRLAAGSESFPLLVFVPEAEGGAFLLDVKRAAAGAADTTPPSQRRVEVPAKQSWPFSMAVTRAGADRRQASRCQAHRHFAGPSLRFGRHGRSGRRCWGDHGGSASARPADA